VNGIVQVQFYANGVLLGTDVTAPYSLVWSNAAFGRQELTAVACDGQGLCSTSAVVPITVNPPPPNVIAPHVVSSQPQAGAVLTNLTTLRVIFNEIVFGVDAADLLVNGVPATGVTGSGSNYLFTLVQPGYGRLYITWATNHGIIDVGYPSSLPFDATAPGATWVYDLVDRTAPTVVAVDPPMGATVKELT
jgi:hypothetical protein